MHMDSPCEEHDKVKMTIFIFCSLLLTKELSERPNTKTFLTLPFLLKQSLAVQPRVALSLQFLPILLSAGVSGLLC